jgi:5'-nucleotidase (lipoprotein e(P4) family)
VSLSQARAVPGAVEFANAAVKAGVAIFYVSNRECIAPGDCPGKTATMANMKKLGFPRADNAAAFMFRKEKPDWYGDKVSRRAAIAARHRIVMLLGDDMQDFMAADDVRRYRDRDARITAVVNKNLGRRWFILPNPMYGSWERALPASLEQKYASLRAAQLQAPVPAIDSAPQ